MSELEVAAKELIQWLQEHQIAYALIGGLAVSFRAVERFTRDIDFAVSVESDEQAEEIVRELRSIGYQVYSLLEQTKHGRIATVRLSKGSERSILVDLLFASSGIEIEVAAESEPIEIFPDLFINTATLPALLALKVLAEDSENRPQDAVDIKHLLKEATHDDLVRTEELIRLIELRGYNRGKNLTEELNGFKARFRIR
jgi:predicted nucleotidyltransferase